MPDIVPDDDPFIRSLQEAGIRPPRGPRGSGTGHPPRSPRLGIIIAGLLFGALGGNARYALRGLVVGKPRIGEPITDISGVATAVGAQAARMMRVLALP